MWMFLKISSLIPTQLVICIFFIQFSHNPLSPAIFLWSLCFAFKPALKKNFFLEMVWLGFMSAGDLYVLSGTPVARLCSVTDASQIRFIALLKDPSLFSCSDNKFQFCLNLLSLPRPLRCSIGSLTSPAMICGCFQEPFCNGFVHCRWPRVKRGEFFCFFCLKAQVLQMNLVFHKLSQFFITWQGMTFFFSFRSLDVLWPCCAFY